MSSRGRFILEQKTGVCWCVFPGAKRRCAARFFLEQFHARKLIAATVCADISFCSSRFFFSSSDRRPDLSV